MSPPDEFDDPPPEIPGGPAFAPGAARGGIPQPKAKIPQEHAELLAIPGVCGVGESRDAQGGKVLEAYLEHATTAPLVPTQVKGIPVQTRVVGKVVPRGK